MSCLAVQEIRERGTFVLRTCSDANRILAVEVAAKEEEGGHRVEPLEVLLDLRSKLLMTEIPVELEEETQASAMVDAFVAQLQVGQTEDGARLVYTAPQL